MRIIVSTIMKDEPIVFIERWAESAKEADDRVLIDTGSPRDTVEYARDLGITVHEIAVRPWRFDLARNAGVALLPADTDLIVTLDVDEVLMPGWRDALEVYPGHKRYSYQYVWSHKSDGSPDVSFRADRCYSRDGWRWKNPVHEHLVWAGDGPEPDTYPTPGMVLKHYADPNKPRAQYLPLLAMAVHEDPHDDRMAHYYARELFFRGDWDAARREFVRHLALPSAQWNAERAQSYRYLAKMDDFPERWLLKAAGEDGSRREVWVDLADLWIERGDMVVAAGFAQRALLITRPGGDYMVESDAWDNDRLQAIVEAGRAISSGAV